VLTFLLRGFFAVECLDRSEPGFDGCVGVFTSVDIAAKSHVEIPPCRPNAGTVING
jgi:hypothetical protein